MGKKYRGGKAVATRKSNRSITTPDYQCPNEKCPWTNREKKALIAALCKHSMDDIDSIRPFIPTRTRQEIVWLIEKYKLIKVQKKKSKTESPIEVWLDLVSDLVCYEDEDYSELIGDVMSTISRWGCVDQAGDPDYRNIYKYLEAILTNVPVPQLRAVEAAILLELLYGLASTLRSSELAMLHLLMQWKYELLSRTVVPEKIKEVNEDIRMALENEWPGFREYGKTPQAKSGTDGSNRSNYGNATTSSRKEVLVRPLPVPSFKTKILAYPKPPVSSGSSGLGASKSVDPNMKHQTIPVTPQTLIRNTFTTYSEQRKSQAEKSPMVHPGGPRETTNVAGSSTESGGMPKRQIHVEIVREYLYDPVASGSTGTQTIDLCESSDSDTPRSAPIPRPCTLVRKKTSREFPLMKRRLAVRVSAEQAKQIQAAKALMPKAVEEPVHVEKTMESKSRKRKVSEVAIPRAMIGSTTVTESKSGGVDALDKDSKSEVTPTKSVKRAISKPGKRSPKIEATVAVKYRGSVVSDLEKPGPSNEPSTVTDSTKHSASALNSDVEPRAKSLMAAKSKPVGKMMPKEIPAAKPATNVRAWRGKPTVRQDEQFKKPKLYTLNPLCVPVRLLKLRPKLKPPNLTTQLLSERA